VTGAQIRQQTEADAPRRDQILAAALAVINERGFADTRVAEIAERAEVSGGLVMYHFKTKDHLLAEAMRSAENRWYAEGARRTSGLSSAVKRLEAVIAMTFLPAEGNESGESWSVWLDLWAAAVRQPEVRRVREEFDEHWRETIRTIVREGRTSGEFKDIDADDFAVAFSALLDGLAIQVALEDSAVPPERAVELSLDYAAAQLGFTRRRTRARRRAARPRREPAHLNNE
jgi:AcrR family transcriptional regulator